MKAELNKKTSEFEVTVSLEKKKWQEAQKKIEDKLIKTVSVKGFRKGNVPPAVARKHIAKGNVLKEALESVLEELAKKAADNIPKETMILSGPTYAIDKFSDSDLEVRFIYPVYPDFKLGSYKNLKLKYTEKKVEAKTIDDEIKRMLSTQAMLKTKKGPIAKGDTAIFDFKGKVDGKEFAGGSAEKFQLEIGSGQFIPGFEEQMIGLKSGDKKNVNVTFPKEYHSEELKGKPAVFEILLHDVKEKDSPKADDEFAKNAGIPSVKTLDDLKGYIKDVFGQQERMTARTKFQQEAFKLILDKTTGLIIPSSLVVQEMNNLRKRFLDQIKQQGIELKQYFEMTGLNEVKMDAQFKEQATSRLQDSLVFAEIAKTEKIEITDDEYEAEYKKLAKVYGQSDDAIRGTITKAQMQIPITNDKVLDVIIKNISK